VKVDVYRQGYKTRKKVPGVELLKIWGMETFISQITLKNWH